jgi:hypothetical protein
MGWIKENIDEIHLYVDKSELLIKDIIWAISWIGGIYAVSNTTDKQALSSAYLIFALSLLMEFGLKIKEKKHWFSRVIDGLFCTAIACMLLMAMISLFGAPLFPNHYIIMFGISVGIMIFMLLDFVITWIEPAIEVKQVDSIKKNKDMQAEDMRKMYEKMYNDKLNKGYLGDINKGDGNNE